MTSDAVIFLFFNSLSLFPDLERLVKKAYHSELEEIAIICRGKVLSQEEFLFLAKDGETYWLVPVFKGSGLETIAIGFALGFAGSFTMSLVQGASFGQALLRGFIGGVAGAVGAGVGQAFGAPIYIDSPLGGVMQAGTTLTTTSYIAMGIVGAIGNVIQNTLVPIKPKRKNIDSADSGDRINNDAFDSQINTTSSNQPIPLVYGMTRVGGQIISADVDTINHGKGELIRVDNYV